MRRCLMEENYELTWRRPAVEIESGVEMVLVAVTAMTGGVEAILTVLKVTGDEKILRHHLVEVNAFLTEVIEGIGTMTETGGLTGEATVASLTGEAIEISLTGEAIEDLLTGEEIAHSLTGEAIDGVSEIETDTQTEMEDLEGVDMVTGTLTAMVDMIKMIMERETMIGILIGEMVAAMMIIEMVTGGTMIGDLEVSKTTEGITATMTDEADLVGVPTTIEGMEAGETIIDVMMTEVDMETGMKDPVVEKEKEAKRVRDAHHVSIYSPARSLWSRVPPSPADSPPSLDLPNLWTPLPRSERLRRR